MSEHQFKKYSNSVVEVSAYLGSIASGTMESADTQEELDQLCHWLEWRIGDEIWSEGQGMMKEYEDSVRVMARNAASVYRKSRKE